MKPLSPDLYRQVAAICSRPAPYGVAVLPVHKGPETLAELIDTVQYGPDGTVIPVWVGASGRTIWGSRERNWLSRAWHDAIHLEACAEFDLQGELVVARLQCARVEGLAARAILWAETAGQALYHEAHGAFPIAQRSFVVDALRFGVDHAIRLGTYHLPRKGL